MGFYRKVKVEGEGKRRGGESLKEEGGRLINRWRRKEGRIQDKFGNVSQNQSMRKEERCLE